MTPGTFLFVSYLPSFSFKKDSAGMSWWIAMNFASRLQAELSVRSRAELQQASELSLSSLVHRVPALASMAEEKTRDVYEYHFPLVLVRIKADGLDNWMTGAEW